jgi:hypothetical protein
MVGAQECSLEQVIPASFVSAHLQSSFPIYHQSWPSEDYSFFSFYFNLFFTLSSVWILHAGKELIVALQS